MQHCFSCHFDLFQKEWLRDELRLYFCSYFINCQVISDSGSGFGDLTSIWLARYKDITKNIVIKKTYLDISDSDKIDLMRVSSSI
jgi:hypothetical protein